MSSQAKGRGELVREERGLGNLGKRGKEEREGVQKSE